jgi:hypothetical protein
MNGPTSDLQGVYAVQIPKKDASLVLDFHAIVL